MVGENLALNARQRRPRRLQLGKDVDAVSPLLDHAGYTPNLALDASQTGQLSPVVRVRGIVLGHELDIPQWGIISR